MDSQTRLQSGRDRAATQIIGRREPPRKRRPSDAPIKSQSIAFETLMIIRTRDGTGGIGSGSRRNTTRTGVCCAKLNGGINAITGHLRDHDRRWQQKKNDPLNRWSLPWRRFGMVPTILSRNAERRPVCRGSRSIDRRSEMWSWFVTIEVARHGARDEYLAVARALPAPRRSWRAARTVTGRCRWTPSRPNGAAPCQPGAERIGPGWVLSATKSVAGPIRAALGTRPQPSEP